MELLFLLLLAAVILFVRLSGAAGAGSAATIEPGSSRLGARLMR